MGDPMDELIADLERMVPTPRTRAWGEMPPFVETSYWADRVLAAHKLCADSTGEIRSLEPENGRYDYEDDPGFQDHMRRWEEWRMRMDREAEGTSRRSKRRE